MSEQQQPNFADRLAHKALLNEIAALTERAERVKEKCEQYWNGPAVCEAELHAILEYIHKTLRGDFDTRRETGREV